MNEVQHPTCVECGLPPAEHTAQWEMPADTDLSRLREARFPGIRTSGLYCPRPIVDAVFL